MLMLVVLETFHVLEDVWSRDGKPLSMRHTPKFGSVGTYPMASSQIAVHLLEGLFEC